MRIDLSSPVRKRAFLAGGATILLLAFALSFQDFVEHWLADSGGLQNIARAARIQPLNAQHQEMLGILLLDPSYGHYQDAKSHFERAVAINPHSARAWLGLANAYDMLGDEARRHDAIRHALACDPNNTDVQWQAANLFLTTDLDRSLKLLRGVIESDPSYAPAAMQVAFVGSNHNVSKLMMAVPLTITARLRLMHWLVDRNYADAADRVWPTLISAPGSLRAHDAFFYIDSLIERHRSSQAFAAWQAIARRDSSLRGRLQPDNLIVNGGFEHNLINGGFGWRYTPTPGISASLDTSTFHTATQSLALQIDADGLGDFGFYELVKVDPGAHYRLTGWLHAEELEAAHGVRLGVEDAYTHAQLLLTDEALGSFPWREVDGELTVPANTQLVKVFVTRSPSTGRIRGSLWIDDLAIERQ